MIIVLMGVTGSGKTTVGRMLSCQHYRQELSISVPTVSTYRARILEKLSMRTTAELIRYAVEHRLVV